MASIKDNAIVLRRLDYSETSQVLAFFTRRHGQRRLIAKGVKRSTKKKFSPGIDLLEQGELVFWHRPQSESGLATLTEWRQTNLFVGLRAGLDRWYAGQYAAEITASMTQENDPHPALYDAFVRGRPNPSPRVRLRCRAHILSAERHRVRGPDARPDALRGLRSSRAARSIGLLFRPAGRADLPPVRAPRVNEKRLVSAVLLTQWRARATGTPRDPDAVRPAQSHPRHRHRPLHPARRRCAGSFTLMSHSYCELTSTDDTDENR